MRISLVAAILATLALGACGGGVAREEAKRASDALSSELNRCIDTEAKKIAGKKLDLIVAGYAVRASCDRQLKAVRDNIIARFPGYETEVRRLLPDLDQAVLDRAMDKVALNTAQTN